MAEAALEAWVDCGPDGFVVNEQSVRANLASVAARIPSRSLGTAAPQPIFFASNGRGDAVFLQMLRPQGGKVQFLYFWKAFSEAARLVGSISPNDESLSAELEMLRDRVLRYIEEDAGKVAANGYSSSSSAAARMKEVVLGSSGPGHGDWTKKEIPTWFLIEEVHRAAAMSACPQYWREAVESLVSQMTRENLSLEDVTSVLLSWLHEAALWEPQSSNCPSTSSASPSMEDVENSGLPVYIHVYDVSQEESIQKINRVLAHKRSPVKFGGVFHAGVEVNGLEWSFGFSPSETHPGVSCVEPKTHPQHHYRQTVEVGRTPLSAEDIADIISSLIEEYPGSDYDLLRRNCCHFADDFAKRLGVGGIPSWIHRLARVAATVDSMLQAAPRPIKERIYGPSED